ncbi:MAG: hypothetical protein ABJL99_01950 [Aliishimia sp.]
MNGKYFLPPHKEGGNFKEIFKRFALAGAGRPVDKDGFPQGPWTADLLADAITQIDTSGIGVDLRTVQLWFQDNDKGISTINIRWLARVFGCDDPDATSQWQMVLSTANRRLVERRKDKRENCKHEPQSDVEIEVTKRPISVPEVLNNQAVQRFSLAKSTEAIFQEQSSLGLPVVVFTAATALGLIAFTLNIHSFEFSPSTGPGKQIGFLWAPNWTIVFFLILPVYLALLVELLRRWKTEWRSKLQAVCDPAAAAASWESRLMSTSYSFWAVLFITVVIASGFNWTATHLIPLLSGKASGWPVDWGRIAIFHPETISITSAIIFTGLVFLYNAFCSYLFFTGLIFLNVMVQDYSDFLQELKRKLGAKALADIEETRFFLMNGMFRCTSLGLLITIMMKLQSSFLLSDSRNILDWLMNDLRSLFDAHRSIKSDLSGLRSAPGHFYSFFCVLVIFGTFMNASLRLRSVQAQIPAPRIGRPLRLSWLTMNGAMFLLVASYFLIGTVSKFTAVLFFSLLLIVYLMLQPALGRAAQ